MKLNTTTSILLFTTVLAIGFASCKKNTASCNNPIAAQVIDGGPEAADGCGWQIKVDSTYYHVDNLQTAYQVNNLHVNINYRTDTARHFRCGIAALEMPTIVLSCIEKR